MIYTSSSTIYRVILFLPLLLIISCSKGTNVDKGAVLLATNCTSCHIAPSIQDLPKDMWEKMILPDMGVRMGIYISDELQPAIQNQQLAIWQAGLVPKTPMMTKEDWIFLKNYIISLAPETLSETENNQPSVELTQFSPKPVSLDTINGSFTTFLKYDTDNKRLLIGDVFGNLLQYKYNKSEVFFLNKHASAITDYIEKDSLSYTTIVGVLDPSENALGRIIIKGDEFSKQVQQLHRPVNTLVTDLNNDGENELVVSEFGYLTGKLSLYRGDGQSGYQKRILLEQPGAIRTIAKDIDKDGKEDLVVLISQGDESITIFYQKDNLEFEADKVIRFSPVYGISWFELIDFNNDGFIDIVTVNGDNADNTYIQKPYHGLRIHINDGKNNFEEKYFYPMNGATRFVANDFDKDGDVDFGIISTFPDYENNPEFSFVYLENNDAEAFSFTTNTFEETKEGRWFLMDTGDIDEDGDIDIILSSFTYVFTPVPKEMTNLWNSNMLDIMVLENTLK